MGRTCAVPKCKSGYKSVKEKSSLFAVPKNTELFKKWRAAIPGNALKQSQFVCEKHFEPKFILKEWVGLDKEGRVMAKVNYLNRRLTKFAVPTIFNNDLNDLNSLEDQCESLEDPLMNTPDAECADASCSIPSATQEPIKHKDLPMTPVSTASVALVPPKQAVVDSALSVTHSNRRLAKFAVPTIIDNATPTVPSVSDKPPKSDLNGLNSLEDQCEESLEEPLMNTPDAERADASCSIPSAPQEPIKHKDLSMTPVSTASLALVPPKQEVVDSASRKNEGKCRKNFLISKITISDSTSYVTSENAIIIPPSWGVTEHAEETGQTVVFSNILRTNANGMIINKSVEVKADKTLRYCVFGRFIDPERYQLPTVLTDTTLLPITLHIFRRLRVCQGLDKVNMHHLSVDCVFQDSAQRWRDNNCTILANANKKRCEHCRKMRRCALQRESRSGKTKNIYSVRYLSNPIDRRKLNALRKRISQEKRANNYLKRRIESLTKSLKRKAREISSIRAEALDNKTVIIYV